MERRSIISLKIYIRFWKPYFLEIQLIYFFTLPPNENLIV
jgi:hypothetical protein